MAFLVILIIIGISTLIFMVKFGNGSNNLMTLLLISIIIGVFTLLFMAEPWVRKQEKLSKKGYLKGFRKVNFSIVQIVRPLIIVFFLVFILLWWGGQHSHPSYDSDAKSNLHNLYLGCKAYWADNGGDKECNVFTVANDNYFYVQTEGVNIEGHGNESTFTATAQHMDSDNVFTMDAKGNIQY